MHDAAVVTAQALATLVAGWALYRLWRAVAARQVAVIVIAAGFALRAIGGAALVLVSWFQLPFGRSLQLENGLWFFALDARGYARMADYWTLGGAGDVLLANRHVPSYLYIQLVAVCRNVFGPVHSSALLINLFAYLGAALAIVVWIGGGDARRTRLGTAALAAMALMPSWVLWSLQPLKDTLFIGAVLVFLFGCDRWLGLFRDGEPRRGAMIAAAAVCWLALHVIGGIRWYYACLAWMLWLPAMTWGALGFGERRAKCWLLSLALFVGLAQAVALNLPADLAKANAKLLRVPDWLSREMGESRERYAKEYKAASEILPGSRTESMPGGNLAARGSLVILPRFVSQTAGLATAGGGRGLWFFAEADTIAFFVVVLFTAIAAWRARFRRLLFDGTFVLAVALIVATLPMLSVVSNFGTLLRFREMFMIPMLVIPLVAARYGDAGEQG